MLSVMSRMLKWLKKPKPTPVCLWAGDHGHSREPVAEITLSRDCCEAEEVAITSCQHHLSKLHETGGKATRYSRCPYCGRQSQAYVSNVIDIDKRYTTRGVQN